MGEASGQTGASEDVVRGTIVWHIEDAAPGADADTDPVVRAAEDLRTDTIHVEASGQAFTEQPGGSHDAEDRALWARLSRTTSRRPFLVCAAVPGLSLGASISRFMEELGAALVGQGLTLITHLAGERGRSLADVCASVDASAVVGFGSFDQKTTRELRRAGAAIVFPTGMDDSSATRPVGRMQAEQLIGRGHWRLGYSLPGHSHLLPMGYEPLRGVDEACGTAGIASPVTRDATLESARAAKADRLTRLVDEQYGIVHETRARGVRLLS
ncbi:hypothetical protein [Nocardiopsis synnemataformans]|uniref:hypothetical protein n=1 Tax=Nocardiopsis synnemataformans TaxID=61305 RepID=UPI003EBBEE66